MFVVPITIAIAAISCCDTGHGQHIFSLKLRGISLTDKCPPSSPHVSRHNTHNATPPPHAYAPRPLTQTDTHGSLDPPVRIVRINLI